MNTLSLIIALLARFGTTLVSAYPNSTCGMDLSARFGYVHIGRDHMSMYPWVGFMYYEQSSENLFTISVVLVTKQLVIGSASELDRFPKDEIRKRSRVVLGSSCAGQALPIKEYTFHRDYNLKTYSSLALIQLDTTNLTKPLHQICPPPSQNIFDPANVYAISLPKDCKNPFVRVYKMKLVDLEDCQIFYRRSGLDIERMWPTYTTCARAVSSPKCVWNSGVALVMWGRDGWRLLGFGVVGPGCGAPARFLDYGRYRAWVGASVRAIGQPAITRLAPNSLVLRRSLSTLQRHGRCETEEIRTEIFTDHTKVAPPSGPERRMRYNLTIYANIEYTCVTIDVKARPMLGRKVEPMIFIRHWCTQPYPFCYDAQLLEIDFYVEIYFDQPVELQLYIYGKEIKFLDVKKFMSDDNHKWDEERGNLTLGLPPA